ncbi:DUF3341 domain-containing protein [Blattabacterium cuenoti]|uniref:DUF3341 domain-containing protein n=1 Tax=Blattabacterium cuenoti TaxID=1653831 RepID=UPI00163C236C|nr:DUF3341 domain-containing protein [Blattabacterium cuenoti]
MLSSNSRCRCRTPNVIHALYNNKYLMIDSIKLLIKNKNIKIKEVYSPFPIHNLDKLLKLKPTNLSIYAFIYGLFGFCFSNWMIWYIMIYDWPQNIGGKPSFSWIQNLPSFIPVIFELSIYFSAHFMCITYMFQCKLFPWKNSKNPDPRTTDHLFLIEIDYYNNNRYSILDVSYILQKQGAIEVHFK